MKWPEKIKLYVVSINVNIMSFGYPKKVTYSYEEKNDLIKIYSTKIFALKKKLIKAFNKCCFWIEMKSYTNYINWNRLIMISKHKIFVKLNSSDTKYKRHVPFWLSLHHCFKIKLFPFWIAKVFNKSIPFYVQRFILH